MRPSLVHLFGLQTKQQDWHLSRLEFSKNPRRFGINSDMAISHKGSLGA